MEITSIVQRDILIPSLAEATLGSVAVSPNFLPNSFLMLPLYDDQNFLYRKSNDMTKLELMGSGDNGWTGKTVILYECVVDVDAAQTILQFDMGAVNREEIRNYTLTAFNRFRQGAVVLPMSTFGGAGIPYQTTTDPLIAHNATIWGVTNVLGEVMASIGLTASTVFSAAEFWFQAIGKRVTQAAKSRLQIFDVNLTETGKILVGENHQKNTLLIPSTSGYGPLVPASPECPSVSMTAKGLPSME